MLARAAMPALHAYMSAHDAKGHAENASAVLEDLRALSAYDGELVADPYPEQAADRARAAGWHKRTRQGFLKELALLQDTVERADFAKYDGNDAMMLTSAGDKAVGKRKPAAADFKKLPPPKTGAAAAAPGLQPGKVRFDEGGKPQ